MNWLLRKFIGWRVGAQLERTWAARDCRCAPEFQDTLDRMAIGNPLTREFRSILIESGMKKFFDVISFPDSSPYLIKVLSLDSSRRKILEIEIEVSQFTIQAFWDGKKLDPPRPLNDQSLLKSEARAYLLGVLYDEVWRVR